MRAIIKLKNKEKKELTKLKNTEKNNKIYRRYMYLELSSKGMTNVEIASVLGVCNDTLTDWKVIFLKGGLKALSKMNYEKHGRKSKLEKYKKEIKELEKKEGFATLKELKEWLKKEHKIESCISNLFYFCKKNSIFLTKKHD